ncbi:MAG: hypothetical protein HFH01_12165 [Dorea sp.]|nr:hypothetical protein [Dorea sp.]
MKRFIRYLYEYEQGKRMRNVGFVKVEQGEDECMVHIHGKGLRMGSDKNLQVYLLFEDGGTCFGIWQGEADNVNPAVNECISYTEEEAGTPEIYARIGGVALENRDGRRFAAIWDDTPMDISGMRIWRQREERPGTRAEKAADQTGISGGVRGVAAQRAAVQAEKAERTSGGEPEGASPGKEPDLLRAEAGKASGLGDTDAWEEPDPLDRDTREASGMMKAAGREEAGMQRDEMLPEGASDEPERMQPEEEPAMPEVMSGTGMSQEPEGTLPGGAPVMPEVMSGTGMSRKPEVISGTGTSQEPEEAGEPDDLTDPVPMIRSEGIFFTDAAENPHPQKGWRTKKIQRTELAKLARCEWRLANNNFLLHGYYNYHHLILLERGEQYMLGVPGIYHEKEAAAAGAFGFPEFIAKDRLEIKLSQEECNEDHPFGYWCRPVKRAFRWE